MYALASLGLRVFCVPGVGQCWAPLLLRSRRGTMSTTKGRMYALASSGSASFACHAWDNIGVRCFYVAGVGQCALSRCRMYVLASLGLRVSCVAGVGQRWASLLLRGRRATMCAAKGSDVCPGVPRALLLLRGRRGTTCIAKGSDACPGVPRVRPFLCGSYGSHLLTHLFIYPPTHAGWMD